MGRRDLTGRRVLLTGASAGVGRAVAERLAACRTHLLLVARNTQRLQALVPELRAQGAAQVEIVAGDLTQGAVRSQAVQRVQELWGGLDLLINNAGVSAQGRFVDGAAAAVREVFELNFFATVELTRLAVPLLRAGNSSVLVNIGSVLGHRGVPFNSAYCGSKFALRGWSEAIRPELKRLDIDLLLVSPGTIQTDFFDHLVARTAAPPWPQQRGIAPQAVASQIVRALQSRRQEIYPNWRGRLLLLGNRYFPRLVDRFMQRYG